MQAQSSSKNNALYWALGILGGCCVLATIAFIGLVAYLNRDPYQVGSMKDVCAMLKYHSEKYQACRVIDQNRGVVEYTSGGKQYTTLLYWDSVDRLSLFQDMPGGTQGSPRHCSRMTYLTKDQDFMPLGMGLREMVRCDE